MFVWFSTNTYEGEISSVETMYHTVERFALTVVIRKQRRSFIYHFKKVAGYILSLRQVQNTSGLFLFSSKDSCFLGQASPSTCGGGFRSSAGFDDSGHFMLFMAVFRAVVSAFGSSSERLKVGSSFSESTTEILFLLDFLVVDEADAALGGKYPLHPEESSSESEQ